MGAVMNIRLQQELAGASPEARERQRKFNACVANYIDAHGDTPQNRIVAWEQCRPHFWID